ncbi:hypothetical protein F383_10805 [Gossypium arboreum]|uniref:Uncharacterized protein n=1 Tax=Gossypium arboreum TaxID=29729 RepID=A0A0B0N9G7_GOSAR|nr:hypothetical protein F383_10805 [Gossypium arboreum]
MITMTRRRKMKIVRVTRQIPAPSRLRRQKHLPFRAKDTQNVHGMLDIDAVKWDFIVVTLSLATAIIMSPYLAMLLLLFNMGKRMEMVILKQHRDKAEINASKHDLPQDFINK